MKRHVRGFTLLEVIIAFALLGLALSADGESLYAAVNPTTRLREAGSAQPFVVRIALADGRELARLPAAEAGFLNDLCVMRDGRVFASDSDQSRIFRADADAPALQLWPEPGHAVAANGVACDDARNAIYVAVYNGVSRIDAATGAVLFDRDGPSRVLAAVLAGDGARGWATSTRADLAATVASAGLAGVPATRASSGELLL